MEKYGNLIAEQPVYQDIPYFELLQFGKVDNKPKPYRPIGKYLITQKNAKPNKNRVSHEITRWWVQKTPQTKTMCFFMLYIIKP